MSRFYKAVLIILLAVTCCYGQNPFRFRHIGIEDGLSQGSIYHMLKDSRGFLWLSSQDGINRFDGKNVTVYLSGSSGESSNIQGIAEDSAGNLWVGSHKGIYKYLRRKDQFIKPVLKNSPGERSVHVFNDRKKNVYLLSESGLSMVSGKTLELVTKDLTYNRAQYNNFLQEAGNGDIWLLDSKEGLKKFDRVTKKTSYYFTKRKDNIFGKAEVFNCIAFDRSGNIWLGGKDGLCKFDTVKNTIIRYGSTLHKGLDNLTDVVEDMDGMLWLGTENNGILVFDAAHGRIVHHLKHEDDVPNSLRFNEVSKIYIDENNDVFANSDPQGLDMITAVSSAFSFYTYGKNAKQNLGDYTVRGLAEGSDSTIWIGTELGGINRLDPKTGNMIHYTRKDGLPDNASRYILHTPPGKIWAATITGLSAFNSESNRFEQVQMPPHFEIATILSVGNGLLLLTTNKGLLLFDTTTREILSHAFPEMVGGFAAYMDDGTGQIYLSNKFRGINVFSISEKKIILKDKFLESFHVLQMYHEPKTSNLWACTDRGLIKWDKKQRKILREFGIEDGLHHEYIYGLLPDYAGNFWLSTNRGLSRFNPRSERFEMIKDIQPREYNSRASIAASNGDLYFGSTSGLDRIKPVLLSVKNEHVGVNLTEIIFDEPFADEDPAYIGERSSLKIPYSSNTFSLKFTATDYRSEGLNRYRYFMKGYDTDTIYSGFINQVRYARLPDGKYEFQLQASDVGGNWVSPVRRLRIEVAPPFWKTWWFVSIAILLFSAIGFASVTGYLNYRLQEQRLASEKTVYLEKERSRIARDMNDSLGSEFFGLKLLGQIALSKTQNDGSDAYLQKIVDLSKKISEKISEVIWLTDSDQDTVESLWNYIQKSALTYLKPSGIDYHFEPIPADHVMTVSADRRHEILDFYKLLFEELTRQCSRDQCEARFQISENVLFTSVKNVPLDFEEPGLRKNLEKLRGRKTSNSTCHHIIEIPLKEEVNLVSHT